VVTGETRGPDTVAFRRRRRAELHARFVAVPGNTDTRLPAGAARTIGRRSPG
jgi:3',5'-cyclic AMP phosphodiesterase CpdA